MQQATSLEEAKSGTEVKPLDLLKQKSLQLREALLKKFESQRQGFISKQSTTLSQSDSPSLSSFRGDQQEGQEIECSLCKETLSFDHYYANPFGQFSYVSNTKLLYHAYRQTLSKYRPKQSDAEEEMKESEIPEESHYDPMEDEFINCLEINNGTGGTIVKCAHYAHSQCLMSYLTANESDGRKRDLRKIIGLDFETFQCPLCKHIANVLLPSDSLTCYQEAKLYQKDFSPYNLLEFHTRIISKIVQNQECKRKDLLPVDIRKNPLLALQAVQRFIEHRLMLVDIKGVQEFLTPRSGGTINHNVATKDQYADIINLAHNVVRIILEGQISVPCQGPDADMTEDSIDEICRLEIASVLESRRGWRFLLSDFSSVALQLMYWSTLQSGLSSIEQIEECTKRISQASLSIFKLQLGIKTLYQRQQLISQTTQGLRGDPAALYGQVSNPEVLLRAAGFGQKEEEESTGGLSLVEQLVTPSLLSFLRKLALFKLVLRTAHVRATKNQSSMTEAQEAAKVADEKVIDALIHQIDNNEECMLLTDYLNIKAANEQEKASMISEELQMVLSFMEDPSQQVQILESYALSSLNLAVNPTQELDEGQKTIIKEQILASQEPVTLPLPSQFALIEPARFNLEPLPSDFQTLVQTYYKRKCLNCKKQPKESSVCLLCGRIVCFLQKCCLQLQGQKAGEGELTYHARKCEGGQGLYLCTTNGKIIMVDGEKSCQRASPYVNKFGETFSQNSKRWDNYHLQETSVAGGVQSYQEVRRMYVSHSLSNEIVKDRSQAESVWRPNII